MRVGPGIESFPDRGERSLSCQAPGHEIGILTATLHGDFLHKSPMIVGFWV